MSLTTSWTFELDGHEFYVLQLADVETLVCDLTTGQWSVWADGDSSLWRAKFGLNWPHVLDTDSFGASNVTAGDSVSGVVWSLEPSQGYDDPPSGGEARSFNRAATAQIVARRDEALPCFEVFLTADLGAPSVTGAAVTLETSDDGGSTFNSHETIVVTSQDYTQDIFWRSLGTVNAPGRLFRVVDDGAFSRLDNLDMNELTNA